MFSGRRLALDLGEKRIGIALSDTLGITARPLEVMPRRSRKEDFATLQKLIAQHDVTELIIGLPQYLNGTDSDFTRWVRDYSADLSKKLDVPYQFQDESLSTERARERMRELGYNQRKRQALRDAVAAAIILQDYLDEHP